MFAPSSAGSSHADTTTITRPAVQPDSTDPAPASPPPSADTDTAPPAQAEQSPQAAQATAATERRPVDPQAVATARGNIQATRQGQVRREDSSLAEADADVDPDDPDADDDLGGAQLLQRELGARVIEEIRHE